MRSRFGTTFACRLMCSTRPELNLAMTFRRAQRAHENGRCRSARPKMKGCKALSAIVEHMVRIDPMGCGSAAWCCAAVVDG